MIHKFKVNDKAIVIGTIQEAGPNSVSYIGDIVTITSVLIWRTHGHSGRRGQVHDVDLRSKVTGGPLAFEPHLLKPYYDGNSIVGWETVEWKPKEIINV